MSPTQENPESSVSAPTPESPESTAAPIPVIQEENPKAVWISSVSTPLCKFAHKSSSQSTGTYAMHSHPFYEMVYVITGDVEFMVKDRPYRVGNHSLVTFPPDLPHGVLVDTEHPYERFTLHFDAGCLSVGRQVLLREVLPPHLGAGPSRREECIWRNMEHSGVLQCLETMETLRKTPAEIAETLMPIYVEAVLATLYAVQQIRGGAARPEFHPTTTQQELVLWVEQHYTEPISLDSLAERFFLSRGYINTLFRQATGSTVKAYVQQRRMSYVQMLLSAGLPAAQAANRAGFEDYTTFYRAYVRAFGHAPSAARKAAAHSHLLAEALSARGQNPRFAPGEVWYPENGTAEEDPSMQNAVRIDPEAPMPRSDLS